MPVISLFSASWCHGDEVTSAVAARLEYRILSNQDLLSEAAKRFDTTVEKLDRTMRGPRSVFDRFTHEKARNVAYLRATLAEMVQDQQIYHGYAAHLLPEELTHVLRVCLVAQDEYRVQRALAGGESSAKAALRAIRKGDKVAKEWTLHLFEKSPWDRSLYDMLLPVDTLGVERAIGEICDQAAKPVVQTTPRARAAVEDFRLAARVGLSLAEQGLEEDVSCVDGVCTLTVNKYVVRLDRHRQRLEEIAGRVEGIKVVKIKVGPNFTAPIGYPKMDLPSKILLVDDEKEFVHTLSERLTTRNLASKVAYDGEQALSMVETDAPEVMVLDLKMPGIDGLEVLRRVKQHSPSTEVIILTGHGSEAEEKLAEELGAFAYLHKPVDIDVLAKTMREAYQRVDEKQTVRPLRER